MGQALASASDIDTSTGVDYEQYAIGSQLEISQILKGVMRHAGLITAAVGGDDFFLTTILAVDDEAGTLMLECQHDARHVARMLKRQRLLCNTTLDKVRIQFICDTLSLAMSNNQEALRTALPRDLIRLQRRENYRIATPIAKPVKCTISIPRGHSRASVDLNLLDISCGGISVLTPADLFTPELGACYDCAIHLPGATALRTRVQARNAFMSQLANGKIAQRSGFMFVDLRENMLAAIQRYIMSLERQRNLREIGR